jgi:hypothetical protein
MLIEKKHYRTKNRLRNRNPIKPDLKGKSKVDKSSLVIDKNFILKDMAEIRSNLFISIGLGVSYTIVLSFLIYKLLI